MPFHLTTAWQLVCFMLFFSSTSYSQLSSCAASYEVQSDSLSGTSDLWLTVTFDDIADVGGIQLSVYDADSGEFILELAGVRDTLIADGILLSDRLYTRVLTIDEGRQYRFDINPYNLNGGFITPTELITTL